MSKAHLTAISRKKLSSPMQWLLKKGLIDKCLKGLDYGCGKGFDADAMGFDGWDLHHRKEPYPSTEYDVVTCNYVLNVIEDPDERKKVEGEVFRLTAKGGTAFISVRNDKDALNGYTSRGTWQGVVEPLTEGWTLIESNSKFKLWMRKKS